MQGVTCGLDIGNDRKKKTTSLVSGVEVLHFKEVLTRPRRAVGHPWASALTGPAAVRCVYSSANKAKDKRRLSESSRRLKAERKRLSPLSIWPVSRRPRRHNAAEVTVTATDRTAKATAQVQEDVSHLHVSLFLLPLPSLHLPPSAQYRSSAVVMPIKDQHAIDFRY